MVNHTMATPSDRACSLWIIWLHPRTDYSQWLIWLQLWPMDTNGDLTYFTSLWSAGSPTNTSAALLQLIHRSTLSRQASWEWLQGQESVLPLKKVTKVTMKDGVFSWSRKWHRTNKKTLLFFDTFWVANNGASSQQSKDDHYTCPLRGRLVQNS